MKNAALSSARCAVSLFFFAMALSPMARATLIPTTTTITNAAALSGTPSTFNDGFVVQWSVTPSGTGTPTGTVSVSIAASTESCSAPVGAGQCTITPTSAGTKQITASYGGDANFSASSSSPAVHHVVNPVATVTTITNAADLANPTPLGSPFLVQWSVTPTSGNGTPTGSVFVTIAASTEGCSAPVGTGQCMVTPTSAGTKQITASYGGNANFNGSSSSPAVSHVVDPRTATTTAITNTAALGTSTSFGTSFTVQWSVTPTAGTGTPTGSVLVTIVGSTEGCTGTVSGGQCTVTPTSTGTKQITASYGGDSNFFGSSSSPPVSHTVTKGVTTISIINTAQLANPTPVGTPFNVQWQVIYLGDVAPTGSVSNFVTHQVTPRPSSVAAELGCSAPVADGQCSITPVVADTESIVASYGGDDNFLPSDSAPVDHTVTPVCTAPPPNMVAWWPGDGNTRDIRGGNNGVLQNGATFAPGKVGQAFSLDGVSNYVQIPHNSTLNPSGPFSVDVWLKANSQQSSAQSLIIDKSHGHTDGTGWAMQTNTDGTACFFYGTGGNTSDFHGVCTIVSVLDNQWHHLAGIFTGAEFRIYLDGALNNTLTFNTPIANNTRAVNIGASWGGGSPTRFFHGLIDEAEYFNRALTDSEVLGIFNAGSAGKCKPPQPTTAFSRKTHGGAGTFDIDLMPAGTPGIECRSSGASNNYQVVFSFPSAVTFNNATLSAGAGSVNSSNGNGTSTVTVNLTGVTNAQRIMVTLQGASDGTSTGDVSVPMGVLIGDTNSNGTVNSTDVSQTKLQSGAVANAANFRVDVNANGSINSSDVSAVKSRSGTSLP